MDFGGLRASQKLRVIFSPRSAEIKSRDDTYSLHFASHRVVSAYMKSILSPGPYIYEINHKDKSSMSDHVSHGCQIFSTPGEIAWNAVRNARLHNPLE